jgi:hypothetical protein
MATTKIIPEVLDLNQASSSTGLRMPKGSSAYAAPPAVAEGMMRNEVGQISNGSVSSMQHFNGTDWKNFTNRAACTTSTCLYPPTASASAFALYELQSDGGTANDVPDTCGANLGTANAITYSASGKYGNAASFTGVLNGSYISLGNSSLFSPDTQGAITFSCWINTTSGTGYLASKVNDISASATYEWAIELLSGGTLTLYAYNTQASVVASSINNSTNVIDGNWHHVVAVIVNNTASINGSTTLYIDGVPATSTSWTGTAGESSNAVVFLGAVGNSDATPPVQPNPAQHYGGLMDQVRFYKSALSQAQVNKLYNEVAC